MVRRFLVKVLVSSVALWIADILLSDFLVAGGITAYLLAGLLLGALNIFVRPVLKLLTFPLILLSFGLFTVVINAAILWSVAHVLDSVVLIANWWTLFWATFIVSTVQTLFEPASH